MSIAPKLILSEEDYQKLSALVAAYDSEAVAVLEEEIGRAKVVPTEEIPSDRVTMHAIVKVKDLETGIEHDYELVFPHEANLGKSRISVVAPLGMALIGLRVGDEYEWTTPAKRQKKFVVVAIQPAKAATREAAGQ
jgi:regulator of nucleoside diphosphate kinase